MWNRQDAPGKDLLTCHIMIVVVLGVAAIGLLCVYESPPCVSSQWTGSRNLNGDPACFSAQFNLALAHAKQC